MTSKIKGEAGRRANVTRPLTRSLDLGEEGLAVKATRCRTCGNMFTHNQRFRWYCSPDCQYRAAANRRGRTPMRSLESRFWSYVPDRPDGACWLWVGHLDLNGYGRLTVGRKRRMVGAHRLSYEIAHDITLTSKQHILHSCDVRNCVNPGHLRIGTHADNMRDMRVRERVNTTRLTAPDVRLIRIRAARGESQRALADDYGVSQGTIAFVVQRKTWKHVQP